MDNLTALFDIDVPAQPDQYCVIGSAVQEVPEEYQNILNQQLFTSWRNGGSTDYDIADVLKRAGFRASPTSVNRHRNKKCVCPKEAQ